MRPLAVFPVLRLERLALAHALGGIDAETGKRLEGLWREWAPLLQAALFAGARGEGGHVAVRLPDAIGERVEALWKTEPSAALYADALAVHLCMEAVAGFVPQIGASGCAPLPRLGEAERQALAEAGFPVHPVSGALECRYGVVTHYPYRGQCAFCALARECPKKNRQTPQTEFAGRAQTAG